MNTGKNKKKSKVNIKRIIAWIILILIVFLVLFGIVQLFKLIFSKEKSIGNVANHGFVTQDGSTVFYNKYDAGIVKVKSGKEYQITNENAYFMTLVDDRIYYMIPNDSSSTLIKSVKTNGDDLKIEKTVSTPITKFYMVDNNIYYVTNKNSYGISKLSLEDGSESLIVSSKIQDFVLDDDLIYYTDNVGYLRSVSIETNEIKEITKEYNIKKIQILKKWIYFYDDAEKALCKIKKDGSSKKVVTTFVTNEMYNITNKNIYYFDTVNKQICKTDFKGKKSKALVKLQSSNTTINIVDGILYYTDAGTSESLLTQMYRVKVNGNSTDPIEY